MSLPEKLVNYSKSKTKLGIIGITGVGKSALGRELGVRGLRVADVDEEVEKGEGVSIAEIFEKCGEQGFRKKETEAIKRCVEGDAEVLILGGGALLHSENLNLLKRNCILVWLSAPLETIAERLKGEADSRPKLNQTSMAKSQAAVGLIERLAELWSQRYQGYPEADVYINTEKNVETKAIAQLITERISDWQEMKSRQVSVTTGGWGEGIMHKYEFQT